MEIPVLVEPNANEGFRATTGAPIPLTAEGQTREQALQNLGALLKDRLRNGAEVSSLSIKETRHGGAQLAAIFQPGDPAVVEWLSILEENRRKADEEEGIER